MHNLFLTEFPSIEKQAYFNTGGASLIPNCVFNALTNELKYELEIGRVNQGQRKRFQANIEILRKKISQIINSDSSEIAITNYTTDGINIVLWGMGFCQNDEILTTTNEHLGVLAGLSTLSRLKNVSVRFYEPKQDQFNLQEFLSKVSEKTKLIIISHVFWETGYVVPIKEIVECAHRFNVPVLVDGAQAIGALPVDVGVKGEPIPSNEIGSYKLIPINSEATESLGTGITKFTLPALRKDVPRWQAK